MKAGREMKGYERTIHSLPTGSKFLYVSASPFCHERDLSSFIELLN